MPDSLYNIGIDEWRGFGVDDYAALLVDDNYVFDATHEFVDDVSADEIAEAGYARVAITGDTRVISNTFSRILYDMDDMDFGNISAGANIGGLIIYRDITDDTDSPLMAFFEVPIYPTDGGNYTAIVSSVGIGFASRAI